MTHTEPGLLAAATTDLAAVREQAPLVQCLTNSVTPNFVANVLLALGAAPAMVDIPVEAGAFARIASAVLINLGTPAAEQRAAMREAAQAAQADGTPWVLDPVAVGALAVRTALAQDLAADGPTVIRGNASEIRALSGAGAGGRGVDSADEAESAREAAVALAGQTGAVVAVSGPVDLITDGTEIWRVANGHPWLTRVTGGGCALGAVVAAFAATDEDTLAATVAAHAAYAVAAELAFPASRGPGSFAVAFLDALANVAASDLVDRVHLS